jgi:hypothetical protein
MTDPTDDPFAKDPDRMERHELVAHVHQLRNLNTANAYLIERQDGLIRSLRVKRNMATDTVQVDGGQCPACECCTKADCWASRCAGGTCPCTGY